MRALHYERRAAAASSNTPHPASLALGTFSHKGTGKIALPAAGDALDFLAHQALDQRRQVVV